MDEEQQHHVEMVQGVINRMASNSFLLKGWSVTLAAGLLALAAQSKEWALPVVGFLPAFSFWFLDAYYLRQERLFRCLHNDIRHGKLQDDRHTMNTNPYKALTPGTFRTCFSHTLLLLHGVTVVVIVLAAAVLHCSGSRGS